MEQQLGGLPAERRVRDADPIVEHDGLGGPPAERSQVHELPREAGHLGDVARQIGVGRLVVRRRVVRRGRIAPHVGVVRLVLVPQDVTRLVDRGVFVEVGGRLGRARAGVRRALAAVVGDGVRAGLTEILVRVEGDQRVVGDCTDVVVDVVIRQPLARVDARIKQERLAREEREGPLLVVLVVAEPVTAVELDDGDRGRGVAGTGGPAAAEEDISGAGGEVPGGGGRRRGLVWVVEQELFVGQEGVGVIDRRCGEIALEGLGRGIGRERLDEDEPHNAPVIGHRSAVALRIAVADVRVEEMSPRILRSGELEHRQVGQALAEPARRREEVFSGGASPAGNGFDAPEIGDPVVDSPFRPAASSGDPVQVRDVEAGEAVLTVLIHPPLGARRVIERGEPHYCVGISPAGPVVAPARDVVAVTGHAVEEAQDRGAIARGELIVAPVVDEGDIPSLGGPAPGSVDLIERRGDGAVRPAAVRRIVEELTHEGLGEHITVWSVRLAQQRRPAGVGAGGAGAERCQLGRRQEEPGMALGDGKHADLDGVRSGRALRVRDGQLERPLAGGIGLKGADGTGSDFSGEGRSVGC